MRCCSMRSWEPLSPAPINQISILPYMQLNHPINYKLKNIIFYLHLINICLVMLIKTPISGSKHSPLASLPSRVALIESMIYVESIPKSKRVQRTFILQFSLHRCKIKNEKGFWNFPEESRRNMFTVNSLQCTPIQIYILHLLHVEPSFMLIHGNESR